jgi:hypothetical protein
VHSGPRHLARHPGEQPAHGRHHSCRLRVQTGAGLDPIRGILTYSAPDRALHLFLSQPDHLAQLLHRLHQILKPIPLRKQGRHRSTANAQIASKLLASIQTEKQASHPGIVLPVKSVWYQTPETKSSLTKGSGKQLRLRLRKVQIFRLK